MPLDLAAHTLGADSFARYWDSLPKKDLVPDRCDFDAGSICIPDDGVLVMEIGDEGAARVLRAGTLYAQLFGPGFQDCGANGGDGFCGVALPQLASCPCGWRALADIPSPSGITFRTEFLLLPLSDQQANKRLVAGFAEIVHVVGFGETSPRLKNFAEAEWLDLGAGVPDEISPPPPPAATPTG